MNNQTKLSFFMWCTIINGSILLIWALVFFTASDFIYSVHSHFFPIPREAYNLVMYGFIGLYKLLILMFNVVPWLGLVLTKNQAN
jgi:hypothetical protein